VQILNFVVQKYLSSGVVGYVIIKFGLIKSLLRHAVSERATYCALKQPLPAQGRH
jgi:hypothetical protein